MTLSHNKLNQCNEKILIMAKSDDLGKQISDLIFTLYPQKLKLFFYRPLLPALAYLLLSTFIHIICVFIWGGLSGTKGVTDLSEDILYFVIQLVNSAMIYYYFFVPKSLGNAFKQLQNNGVFIITPIVIDPKVHKICSSKKMFKLPYILAGIYALVWILFIYIDPEGVDYWYEVNPFILIILLLSWYISWVAMAGILISMGIGIFLIHHVFNDNEIRVQPLHPDGSGGLGSLGKYSLKVSSFSIIFALFIITGIIDSYSTGTLMQDYAAMINVIIYVLFVPLIFYLPLHKPRKAMFAFRTKKLQNISEHYDHLHNKIHSDIEQSPESLNKNFNHIEVLENIYKSDKQIPVFPFDIRTVLTVSANAFSPIVPIIYGLLIDTI